MLSHDTFDVVNGVPDLIAKIPFRDMGIFRLIVTSQAMEKTQKDQSDFEERGLGASVFSFDLPQATLEEAPCFAGYGKDCDGGPGEAGKKCRSKKEVTQGASLSQEVVAHQPLCEVEDAAAAVVFAVSEDARGVGSCN